MPLSIAKASFIRATALTTPGGGPCLQLRFPGFRGVEEFAASTCMGLIFLVVGERYSKLRKLPIPDVFDARKLQVKACPKPAGRSGPDARPSKHHWLAGLSGFGLGGQQSCSCIDTEANACQGFLCSVRGVGKKHAESGFLHLITACCPTGWNQVARDRRKRVMTSSSALAGVRRSP